MLPFLPAKKTTSVILARRGKTDVEVNPEVQSPDSHMDAGLLEAAEDVLRAIDTRSATDLAHALDSFFEIKDSIAPEMEE